MTRIKCLLCGYTKPKNWQEIEYRNFLLQNCPQTFHFLQTLINQCIDQIQGAYL